MKKSVIVYLSIFCVLVMAISACNGTPEETQSETSSKTSTNITINYLTIKNADHPIRKALDEIVGEYNSKGGDTIKIEYSTTADRASYDQKLRTQIASKNVPDWFDSDPNAYSRKLAEEGYVANLGEFLENENLKNRVQPMALEFQTFEGLGTFLLPTAVDVEVFWYNTKLFADNQIEVPETFDDFLVVCEKLKSAGVTPISVSGKEKWPMLRYLAYVPFRLANNDFINSAKTGEVKFSSETGMKGINFLYEIGTKGYFQEGFATTDYGAAIDYFISGSAAVFNMGSWQFSSFTETGLKGTAVEGKIDYFLLPTVEGAVNKPTDIWSSGGVGLAFNKVTFDSKSKNFLKYILSDDAGYAEKVYRLGPIFPAIISDSEIDSADPLYNRLLSDIANIEIGGISWDVLLDPVTNSLMGDLSNALALGSIIPSDFASQIDKSVAENAANYFSEE